MKYLWLGVVAVISTPAFAQSGATTTQPSGVMPKVTVITQDEVPEKLICKKQEVIGSLIVKKRVCATAANWERNEVRAKDHLKILTEPGAFAPSG
jgi:hypothetical protein